jgi:hypothetical protein
VSALGAGLFSLGIPKDSIVKYETSVKAGKFVLIAQGDACRQQSHTRTRVAARLPVSRDARFPLARFDRPGTEPLPACRRRDLLS